MPPLPPVPPLPPLPPLARDDGPGVTSFDRDGQHVTIIKRRGGPEMAAGEGRNVLRYKDGEGRDVTVVTDKPITQADAERMEKDMRVRVPEIAREAAQSARLKDRDVQVIVREARQQARDAIRDGDIARKEGEKARQYATVIVKQMKERQGGDWRFDGGPHASVYRPGEFAGPEDLAALRDELHALRDEVRALKEQLRASPSR